MIRDAFQMFNFAPEDIEIVPELGETFHFKPHFGWTGHIEAAPSASPTPVTNTR